MLATDKSLQQDGVTFNDCLSLISEKDAANPAARADSLHTVTTPLTRSDGSMLIFMNAAGVIDGHAAAERN